MNHQQCAPTASAFDRQPRAHYDMPISHRLARAITGATIALSTLGAGFIVFGPVSDARTLALAAGPPPQKLAPSAVAYQPQRTCRHVRLITGPNGAAAPSARCRMPMVTSS